MGVRSFAECADAHIGKSNEMDVVIKMQTIYTRPELQPPAESSMTMHVVSRKGPTCSVLLWSVAGIGHVKVGDMGTGEYFT